MQTENYYKKGSIWQRIKIDKSNKPYSRWYKMEDKQVTIEYGEQDLKEILLEMIKQEYINLKKQELTTQPGVK